MEEGIVHCNADEASETPLTSLGDAANTITLGSTRGFGTLWIDRSSQPEVHYPIVLGSAGGALVGHTGYFESRISGLGPLVVGPRYRAYFRNLSADNTYSGGTRIYSQERGQRLQRRYVCWRNGRRPVASRASAWPR